MKLYVDEDIVDLESKIEYVRKIDSQLANLLHLALIRYQKARTANIVLTEALDAIQTIFGFKIERPRIINTASDVIESTRKKLKEIEKQ